MNEPIDPIVDPIEREQLRLMKFAAGELNRDEENELLLDCEAEPTRWREVALALIEEQRLAAALSADRLAAALDRSRTGRVGLGWLATAACLGAVVGGWGMHAGGEIQTTAVAPTIDHYVLIDSGPSQPIEPLPVTPVTTAVMPLFDPEDYEVIERHGYRLEEEPVFYLVRDGNGHQVTIPSKNIRLTHMGR